MASGKQRRPRQGHGTAPSEPTTQLDDDQLIATYVEQHPNRPWVEEARVVGFAVPVWALVGHYFGVGGQVDQVAQDYDLPKEAVLAALAYYRRHRACIDARLEANAAPIT